MIKMYYVKKIRKPQHSRDRRRRIVSSMPACDTHTHTQRERERERERKET
jgi:hypothetical protein